MTTNEAFKEGLDGLWKLFMHYEPLRIGVHCRGHMAGPGWELEYSIAGQKTRPPSTIAFGCRRFTFPPKAFNGDKNAS